MSDNVGMSDREGNASGHSDGDDPAFETLLSESLGGPPPPDLSASILAALRALDESSSPPVTADSAASILPPPVQLDELRCDDLCRQAVHADLVTRSKTEVGQPKAIGNRTSPWTVEPTPVNASRGRIGVFRSSLPMLVGAASLAASILLAIWLLPHSDHKPLADQQNSINDGSGANSVPNDVVEDASRATGKNVAENRSVATAPEGKLSRQDTRPAKPVQLEGPKFTGGPSAQFGAEPSEVVIPEFASAAAPLADSDIVSMIDKRLAESWSDSEIEPAGSIDIDHLASRLKELFGNASAALNLANSHPVMGMRAIDLPFDVRIGIIDRELQSPETQERLAGRLAGALLGRTGIRRINREQFIQFVSFLRPGLSGEKRYDFLVQEMLAARGSVEPKSQNFNPATVWMGALAGPQSIALAEQAGHALLDVDLKCGRCHDHPLDGRVWQDQYWQFSAMFNTGLQWQVDKGGVLGVSSAGPAEKQNVVFYEKVDGRQRAATPKAPMRWIVGSDHYDGADVESQSRYSGADELERLAGSMVNNPQLARAAVNRVWEAVYGRPLVGSVANPESAPESDALISLQTDLADQFRAHGFDIGRLFMWVIASKPMLLDIPENWRSPRFESASNGELAYAAEQVRNFASFPSSVPRRRFNDLLARVNIKDSNLTNTLEAASNFPGGLLGQFQANSAKLPNNARAIDKAKQPDSDQLLSASLEAIAHVDSVSGQTGEQRLPAKWLEKVEGPDPFQRRAEHLYYLAGYWHPSPQQLEVARALREQSDSDASALRKLWWVLAHESL